MDCKKKISYFFIAIFICLFLVSMTGCADPVLSKLDFSFEVATLQQKIDDAKKECNRPCTEDVYDYSGSYYAILSAPGTAFEEKVPDNAKTLLKKVGGITLEDLTIYVNVDVVAKLKNDDDTKLRYILEIAENTTPIIYIVLKEPLSRKGQIMVLAMPGYSVSDDGKIVATTDATLFEEFLEDGEKSISFWFEGYKTNDDYSKVYGVDRSKLGMEGVLIKK